MSNIDDGYARPITMYFNGDAELYASFLVACAAQLPKDAASGSLACAAGDLETLGSLGHNLKSVLRMLGHDELSQAAAAVELACAARQQGAATDAWALLNAGLLTWQRR